MIIGTGVDLIEVERIERALSRHGQRFLDRLFTPAEVQYCEGGGAQKSHRLAARFAAKEATLKALGTGLRNGLNWTDIEVIRDPLGKPALRLTGKAADLAAQQGITQLHVSLSHAKDYAVAQVVAVR